MHKDTHHMQETKKRGVESRGGGVEWESAGQSRAERVAARLTSAARHLGFLATPTNTG